MLECIDIIDLRLTSTKKKELNRYTTHPDLFRIVDEGMPVFDKAIFIVNYRYFNSIIQTNFNILFKFIEKTCRAFNINIQTI